MLKLMGKKILHFYPENFCLSKSVGVLIADIMMVHLHVLFKKIRMFKIFRMHSFCIYLIYKFLVTGRQPSNGCFPDSMKLLHACILSFV